MDILGTLLGSQNRVKILRLFFLNAEKIIENKEISRRSKVLPAALRREISILSKISFIKKKSLGKLKGWQINPAFPYLNLLRNLLLNSTAVSAEDLSKKLKVVGRIKLIIISGIFIQNNDSRVDLLVVGDFIKKNKIEKTVKDIEAIVGKELKYAFFDTDEFLYRLGIYDKFVRDILDYPHEKILNKLNI